MVTSILLVREDLDPNPVYDDRREYPEATATADMSAFTALDNIIRQGPANYVQTFEGFIESSFAKARSQVRVKNYLDLDNLQLSE